MKLQFKLTENDFLEHQLYIASKSETIKKRRLRSRLLVPVILIFLGTIAYFIDNTYLLLSILYFIIAIIWYIFYPQFIKNRYLRHYKKHIKENYIDRLDKVATVYLKEETIESKDDTSEFKVNVKEFQKLVEIDNYYFLKLFKNQSLIIPKNAIDNVNLFEKTIQDYGIKHEKELDWKWK